MNNLFTKHIEHTKAGNLRQVEDGHLVLWNYTDSATFNKAWDEVTLASRGTVYEKATGEVVARAFDKFFNDSEYDGVHGIGMLSKLLERPHYVQTKEDGLLGIVYFYSGEWRVNTRGSFSSEQAIKGKEILARYKTSAMSTKHTYLVEIIYPENRIIVPQTEEKLVLLAVRHTHGGGYLNPQELAYESAMSGMPLATIHPLSVEKARELKATLPYTEEGWVVVFDNGERIKIKGDEYLRLAKFKADLSPLAVWEAAEAGRFMEFAESCPEEFREEFDSIRGQLADQEWILVHIYNEEASKIRWCAGFSRKELAVAIKQAPKWTQGALFAQLDGKDPYKILHKLLRPKGNQLVSLQEIMK